MKISTVLTAVNNEILYIDFIPNFIKHWSYLFPDINIKIILIGEKIPEEYIIYQDNIVLFNSIPNIPSAFQAMCIRNLYPALLKSDGGIIITDIDMMPMNRKYYEQSIKNFDNDKFIVYRDVLIDINEYPMCYNIATSIIWSKIFNIKNIENLIETMNIWYEISNYKIDNPYLKGIHNFDQKILFTKLQEFNNETNNLIVLNDEICNYRRLDRLNTYNKNHSFVYDLININDLELELDIKNLTYHDYHSLRPYKEYKIINDKVLNILMQSNILCL